MAEELSKVALTSGRLNGTKTLENVFNQKENLDEVETFLKELIHLKINLDISDEPIYINDDQDFMEHLDEIENSEFISIYVNENDTRLYMTIDERKTYIIRIHKVSSSLIAKFISKEKPVKFSLNSFHFIKWCVSEKIDMRNLYDIPTYLKILTNEVDPFQDVGSYIKQYTNFELEEEDNEKNSLVIGNFIYEFGKYLNDYAKKFQIDSVCKLINENSYFEAVMINSLDNCTLKFSYSNLKQAIEGKVEEKEKEFQGKEYIISPLGRIAVKFGHDIKDVIRELYVEDISITLLNELYNNNIPVALDEEGDYIIRCKYKNVGSVFTFIIAILDDIFYTMFEQTFQASIQCDIM